jgi:predicted small lipoprotein YifL
MQKEFNKFNDIYERGIDRVIYTLFSNSGCCGRGGGVYIPKVQVNPELNTTPETQTSRKE